MNRKERAFIASILAIVSIMIGLDLLTDSREGVVYWHVLIEGGLALLALFGVFYVLRGSVQLRNRLTSQTDELTQLKKQADVWRAQSRKYLEGLSQAIDRQLTEWQLTHSEKQVAFLLLKGMSLKEIAELRNTSEKTARAQSTAIYTKAGLSGRAELAAFFLEDLLVPQSSEYTGLRVPQA